MDEKEIETLIAESTPHDSIFLKDKTDDGKTNDNADIKGQDKHLKARLRTLSRILRQQAARSLSKDDQSLQRSFQIIFLSILKHVDDESCIEQQATPRWRSIRRSLRVAASSSLTSIFRL